MRIMKVVAILLAVGLAGAGGSPGQAATASAEPTGPAARLARQHDHVSLNAMPLQEVLTYYGKLSGLDIQADWDALAAAGIKPDTPVTLKAYGLSFEKLLDLTIDSVARKDHPLTWYLSGDVIHVSSQRWILLVGRPILPALAEAAPGPPGRPAPPKTRPRRRVAPEQISFDQTPLHMVIEFLRDLTGLNLHVNWRALEITGITKDTPITLKARGISIRRLLDLLMDQLSAGRDRFSSVYWIVNEGVVQIATGDAFNRSTRTQVFDVSDLLMHIPNFRGPSLTMQNESQQTTGEETTQSTAESLFEATPADQPSGGQGQGDRRGELRQKLIEAIKQSIGEEMWAPQGRGSIRILRGNLIITQTPLGFKLLARSMTVR